MSRPSVRFRLFLVAAGVLVGCHAQEPTGAPSSTPSPTPATVVPTPTASMLPAWTAAPGSVALPTGPITLTIWTVEQFAPAESDPGGRQLLEQLLVFDRSHSDVELDVVVKRATGPGGIEDYFRTASPVAPSVLPDLAVLSRPMLVRAAAMPAPTGAEFLVQPLDEVFPAEMLGDLFSVARQLGTIDDRLLAVPFMLDLEHLIYSTAVLTGAAPATWEEVLQSGGPYLFPAAEEASMDTPLLHYLAAGGKLVDEEGKPRLEIDPLTDVFRFYQRADATRVIPVAASQARSLAECWNGYRGGSALIAHVSAAQYLSGRAELFNTGVAPIPGPTRPGSTFVSGWQWAIITPDPGRQQLAVELLTWLMETENLGVWSYSGRWLPASNSAFTVWPTDDGYVAFAREQIQSAVPRPDEDYFQAVQANLAQAVRAVLLDDASPAGAAASAIR